jgi:alpha-N-arabinofuranosidase
VRHWEKIMKTDNALFAIVLFSTLSSAALAMEYHVAITGNDANDGSRAAPLKTISAAARRAQSGDVVTVHAGVYRERVNPPRGGESDQKRIAYQAAAGEKVVITGSEVINGWERVGVDTWKVSIPNKFFGDFNPYSDLIHGDWFSPRGRQHHTGAVYQNGVWLIEAASLADVLKPAGKQPLWYATVDAASGTTTIWAQFKGAGKPSNVEINVRKTVFTPDKTGVNYITVRGFTLRNAATNWAPPTAGQIGLVSAYWSKGWIIEDNDIAYSKCSGVALGKYGDAWDNRAESAEGYVGTLTRALANGWNKATIGSHIVRNNRISHCEQAGIVGSLGCSFSTVTGNEIHDIHVLGLFSGAEMAGIKFHGAIDVEVSRNHIYRCNRGLWFDWMAQGTQVVGNLLHDNGPAEDIFFEVDHGPFVVANNVLLSHRGLWLNSQGGAFAHNLLAGTCLQVPFDGRMTPLHKAHSTVVTALHDNPSGDHRFYNNLVTASCNLHALDGSRLPCRAAGNVFTQGTQPPAFDPRALVKPEFDPQIKLTEKPDGWYLTIREDPAWREEAQRPLVTTELLGLATIPGLPYENADGSPLAIRTDYFGNPRNPHNPFPGPFESIPDGRREIKVWAIVRD